MKIILVRFLFSPLMWLTVWVSIAHAQSADYSFVDKIAGKVIEYDSLKVAVLIKFKASASEETVNSTMQVLRAEQLHQFKSDMRFGVYRELCNSNLIQSAFLFVVENHTR